MITEELLEEYRNSKYVIADVHIMRIGSPLPIELIAWLTAHRATTAALLGAEYPGSKPTSAEENECQHQALIKECTERGLHWLPAVGMCETWQERHVFVAGLDNNAAHDFCTRYQQNAVVTYSMGGVAELLIA
jgi:hypothetical protein